MAPDRCRRQRAGGAQPVGCRARTGIAGSGGTAICRPAAQHASRRDGAWRDAQVAALHLGGPDRTAGRRARRRRAVTMKAYLGATILGTLMAIAMTTAATAATAPGTAVAPDATTPVLAVVHRYGFDLKLGRAVITVRWLAANILRVHYLPDAHA